VRSKQNLNQGGDPDAGSRDEGKCMVAVTRSRRLKGTRDAFRRICSIAAASYKVTQLGVAQHMYVSIFFLAFG
jgi:hypothetical protein